MADDSDVLYVGPGRAAAVFPLEHGKVRLPSRFPLYACFCHPT